MKVFAQPHWKIFHTTEIFSTHCLGLATSYFNGHCLQLCQQQNMGVLIWREKCSCFSLVFLFSLRRAPLWKGVRFLRTVNRWRMIFLRTQVRWTPPNCQRLDPWLASNIATNSKYLSYCFKNLALKNKRIQLGTKLTFGRGQDNGIIHMGKLYSS